MESYDHTLQTAPLFAGIAPDELHSMLNCLSARKMHYPKGSIIHHHGDRIDSLGLVLSGTVDITKEDFWGNTNLITRCEPGDIFGEAYALRAEEPLDVSVLAEQSADVLFFNLTKMMTLCSQVCGSHSQLTKNLLALLAKRNRELHQKLEHITKRTTREKLLSYLSSEAERLGNSSFDIPFNRQQLADYLSVDRSAMSNELGHLRDEGLITFRKNHFTVQFPSS